VFFSFISNSLLRISWNYKCSGIDKLNYYLFILYKTKKQKSKKNKKKSKTNYNGAWRQIEVFLGLGVQTCPAEPIDPCGT